MDSKGIMSATEMEVVRGDIDRIKYSPMMFRLQSLFDSHERLRAEVNFYAAREGFLYREAMGSRCGHTGGSDVLECHGCDGTSPDNRIETIRHERGCPENIDISARSQEILDDALSFEEMRKTSIKMVNDLEITEDKIKRLRNYAHHSMGCPANHRAPDGGLGDCNCGLEVLMEDGANEE